MKSTILSACSRTCDNHYHALSCPKGDFPSIRHYEIRDLTANLLTEVCSDVYFEPELQLITGEALTGATSNAQDGAHLNTVSREDGLKEPTLMFFNSHTLTIQPVLLLPQARVSEEACI